MEVYQRRQIMALQPLIQLLMKLSAEFRSQKCRGINSRANQMRWNLQNLPVLSALLEEEISRLWMISRQALMEPNTPNNLPRLLTLAILHQTTQDSPFHKPRVKLTQVKLEFRQFSAQTI